MQNAKIIKRYVSRMLSALILIPVLILGAFRPIYATYKTHPKQSNQVNVLLYFPVVFGPDTPTGSFKCTETEFGLIWKSETITLNVDGTSVYAYDQFSVQSVATGTWTYTPATRAVNFTNFSWSSAVYVYPNELSNSEYLPGPGFWIGIGCSRVP